MGSAVIIARRELAAYFATPVAVVFIVIFLAIFMGFTVDFWGSTWILVGLLVGARASLGEMARLNRTDGIWTCEHAGSAS